MSDPGKVIVALGFFTSLTYVVRLITLGAMSNRRRGEAGASGLVMDEARMARLEQAVESIALEVERISEGQRFTTRLLAERAQADRAGKVPAAERRNATPH